MRRLDLAVAGGRKTQSIIDACASASRDSRILVLTYTQVNQAVIRKRLAACGGISARVEVMGWFSFLMSHWIRPYLPLRFAGCRLRGLNFDGESNQYATGKTRFLDGGEKAYKRHLARLATEVGDASSGAVLDRITRIYDTIFIDEVQDLNGYDLELLDALLDAPINLRMVGDIRQAVVATNPRDPKNRQYKGLKIKNWFDKQVSASRLEVRHSSTTWRSNQTIADFADSIFEPSWGFARTQSENGAQTGHDGIFVLSEADARAYVRDFKPLCLRHSVAIARGVDLPFVNIVPAKGMDVERVLIWPTKGVREFLRTGKRLDATPSCSLYVAVTRAQASAAFVVDDPRAYPLPGWSAS